MIHFDFIVTDAEAEDLFSMISDEIDRCRTEALSGGEKAWHRTRIDYLEELKRKMTNSKIS